MTVSSKLATLLLPLLVAVGACKQQPVSRSAEGTLFIGAHESTDVVERVVSPGNRQLVLDGYAGTVWLSRSNSDVARLSITRRARGDSPTDAQNNLSGLDIQEEGDEATFRYRFTADKPELSSFDIRGEVPAATDLLVKWTSGSIQVEGLNGSVDIRTVNGDIGFVGASYRARLQSHNGDVTATLLASRTTVAADSLGPIPAAQRSYELVTANGDIVASIPSSISVRVDAMTTAGSIRTSEMPFTDEKFGPVNAGARFTARLGTGSGKLKLATQHGAILLRESLPAPVTSDPVGQDSSRVDVVGEDGMQGRSVDDSQGTDSTSATSEMETPPTDAVDTVRPSSN